MHHRDLQQGDLQHTDTQFSFLQATFLYASLLRQLAHQGIQDLLGISPGSTTVPLSSDAAATAIAAAVGQLRQAAGVYEHLAEVMLPPLFTTLHGDRYALTLVCAVDGAVRHMSMSMRSITAVPFDLMAHNALMIPSISVPAILLQGYLCLQYLMLLLFTGTCVLQAACDRCRESIKSCSRGYSCMPAGQPRFLPAATLPCLSCHLLRLSHSQHSGRSTRAPVHLW